MTHEVSYRILWVHSDIVVSQPTDGPAQEGDHHHHLHIPNKKEKDRAKPKTTEGAKAVKSESAPRTENANEKWVSPSVMRRRAEQEAHGQNTASWTRDRDRAESKMLDHQSMPSGTMRREGPPQKEKTEEKHHTIHI